MSLIGGDTNEGAHSVRHKGQTMANISLFEATLPRYESCVRVPLCARMRMYETAPISYESLYQLVLMTDAFERPVLHKG